MPDEFLLEDDEGGGSGGGTPFSLSTQPENFPPELIVLLETGWARSVRFCDITLDDGTPLHLSDAEIAFDGVTYSPDLRQIGALKGGITKPADRVQLSAQNITSHLGHLMLTEIESRLDHVPAVFGRIYFNINNQAESYKVDRVTGYVTQAKAVDGDQASVEFAVYSDVYAHGGVGAVLEVSPECGWKYKHPTTCAYDGDLPTCDYTYSGSNGCEVHINQDGENNTKHYGGWGLDRDITTSGTFSGADGDGTIIWRPPGGRGPYDDDDFYGGVEGPDFPRNRRPMDRL